MFERELLNNYIIPVIAALIIILLGTALLFLLMREQALFFIPVFFGLGGVAIGYLTPDGEVDHRGTNGMVVMVFAWTAYISYQDFFFPFTVFMGQRLMWVIGCNIVNGFVLILGGFLGTWIRRCKDLL